MARGRVVLAGQVAAVLALACGIVTACGGRLVPDDVGDGGNGEIGDAAHHGDAGNDAGESGQPCILDASEDTALCTAPPDDFIYASPSTISVPAGAYGEANFVASGPWSTYSSFYMHYEGSTLDVLNDPYVLTYGTPERIQFLLPPWAAGQQGTLTVSGHLGNIKVVAVVDVTVTPCVPVTSDAVCGSAACGNQPNGCGGQVSCGTCEDPGEPYCWLGRCIARRPPQCFSGFGFDPDAGDAGECIPCATTEICERCPAMHGTCQSNDDLCICQTFP